MPKNMLMVGMPDPPESHGENGFDRLMDLIVCRPVYPLDLVHVHILHFNHRWIGFAGLSGLDAASSTLAAPGGCGFHAILPHAFQQQIDPGDGQGEQYEGDEHG
jgi:hypothetical protein